jgi:hypothetical protein
MEKKKYIKIEKINLAKKGKKKRPSGKIQITSFIDLNYVVKNQTIYLILIYLRALTFNGKF